ncbi:MAG: hypothetical protein M9894_17155 [Planctomycetes bacterium]|nr:hypothetical protein [Planctomycetota bacterium]
MSGTLIAYQGFRAQSAVFRRTRGYDSDFSEVVFPVESFPAGFDFTPPQIGGRTLLPDLVVPDLGVIRARTSAAALPDFRAARRLDFAGTLVMAEVQDEEWQVVVHPLFVMRIDRIKQAESGRAMVRVTLGDARLFWGEGFLRRWSFNRVRGDGSVALDSVKFNREPLTRAEVASDVVRSLWSSPRLAVAPATWSAHTGPEEFPRYCPAAMALRKLCTEGNTLDPCLRLDGTVALHREGEGRAGWAPQGQGENVNPFPEHVRLSKQGQGQGYSVEPTHVPDYVVIAGGRRIASVALDECPPVLMVPRRVRAPVEVTNPDEGPGVDELRFEGPEVPRLLTEELVRELTGGRFGLDWLKRWIVQPAAYQHAVGLDAKVVKLLSTAWRLFQIPGAQVEQQDPDDGTPPASVDRTSELDPDRAAELAAGATGPARRAGSPGPRRPAAKPGPNAHVLPLLDRAETVGGKRLPVRVETFTWTTQHRVFDNNAGALGSILYRRSRLRSEIDATARETRQPHPISAREYGLDVPLTAAELLGDLVGQIPVSVEEVQAALDKMRTADRIKQQNASQGAAWEGLLLEEAKALDALNGTNQAELLDLAAKLLQFDKDIQQLRRDSAVLETTSSLFTSLRSTLDGSDAARARRERLRLEVAEDLRAIARKRQEQDRLASIGGDPAAVNKGTGAIIIRNLPRRADEGAQVYCAELGVVATSSLAGHIEPDGVPGPEAGVFKPMPVRTTFGAVVRPLADRPPPPSTGTREGPANLVPPGLGDEVTWFARAFRRGGARGAPPVLVRVEDVPHGQGLAIPREDLVELIPLEGAGNGAELELAAGEVAAETFNSPDRVEGATYTLARPWPVQCDGVVSSVEIRSRDTPVAGTGFETVVTVGGPNTPDPNPLRTVRVRPVLPRGNGDGTRREGLE